MILALDTATRLASLALYDGARLLAEETWLSNSRHTVELLPRVDRAMRAIGQKVDALTGVAVAIGPGSYTGLRIALSLAKGLAFARDLPLVGIPTLEIAAHPHRCQPLPVCAVIEAGRRRFCWAFYGGGDGISSDAHHWGTLDELIAQVQEPTFFTGELEPETRARLSEVLGERAHLASPALALRRAGILAELAWQRLRQGEVDNAATLSPLYLREP